MKKRVFIIHGWGDSPEEELFSWLKVELTKKGYEVIAPEMPNTDEPKIEEWVPFLAGLVGEPDENTSFVGRSIGCQTIMRYLESVSPQKVGHLVFIAGWFHLDNLEDAESEEIAKPWIETPIDFEKIKSAARDITVFMSDNDPWVPLSDKEIFQEKLNAKVTIKKGKGHFTKGDGVVEMEEVMDIFE